MLEGIPPSLVQGATVVGVLVSILSALIYAVWKGHLVTRPQIEKLMEIQEGRIKTAEEREARTQSLADKWAETAQQAIANNEANIEQGKMVISLLQAAQTRGPRR